MLDISKKNKDILVNEIDYVCKKISQSTSPSESIYYFSAIHGMIHRVMNLELDADLIFLHLVMRHMFDVVNGRSQANAQGDTIIILDETFFDKVCELLDTLKNNIDSGSDITGTLKNLVMLTYSITGNGNFLFEKNNFDALKI